ncbi:trypsin-like peptidase domain-containing protein [filamentous cyanobacterium LEGE 11480]|uniref:Trypsin-like peptidase domain-containing protein n=1 Tax=Romeriopsis navalis LEGE 11480 TaxID=2777977 RepID=A0A928VK43_9CYAN|nr:HhoA/HhoB/HtrA family serine endopeptidase [Romeriopsis navalis]MBE9029112.1 trypsin-like peptidase domain-containing protein [Romeriopsis navalis LEGE 11480]
MNQPTVSLLQRLRANIFAIFLGVALLGWSPSALATTPAPRLQPAAPPKSSPVAPPTRTVRPTASPTEQVAAPKAVEKGSFVAAAVKRVGNAVVRIDTEKTISRRPSIDPMLDDPFFRRFFGDDLMMPQGEERLRGQGSGFLIDANGTILTNSHVVNGADRVTVTLKDGRKFDGKVSGVDEVTDLAVVKVAAKNLPVSRLGDSDKISVGDWAIAVGNPLGLDNTVTLGIVSTLNRSSAQIGMGNKRLDFIQTDAAINPGNSGGPLLNEDGEVIGINTAIRADANGIGFAIPINKAKELQPQLANGEKIRHPYLGIQMSTFDVEMAKNSNDDPNSLVVLPEVNGVIIIRVLEDTPAAKAGLRRYDVITAIDGQAIHNADELQQTVDRSKLGSALKVEVHRGDKTMTITVRTAELKQAEQ